MADTITIRTSTERDVVKIVERGPQGPAGGGGGGGSGTVTSVALAGTGLSVTGSPVTLSGTITANVVFGTTAGTACEGNDGRIANIKSASVTTIDGNDGGVGGTINLAGWESSNGGSLTMNAEGYGNGGSINTSDGGGSITTTQGGGSINTSNGGGSIDTRGTGSIQFGVSGTRTTLTGTATADRAISLPNAAGTLALTSDITKTAVGLGNVTNNAQTQAAIVPNTAPSAGQLLVGNAGGTAYAPAALSGDATIASTGVLTLANTSTARTNIGLGNVANVDTTNAANISSGVLPNARVNWAAPSAIGSTTAADGTFTTLTANNGTLTASAPVLDLSQTWNNASVTFTGLKSNVTATAAASNSMFADVQAGGYSQFGIARISSTSNAVWLYNTNSGTNTNGVGANYERGFMRWSSNVLQIGTEKAGTGSARALEFQTDGTTRLTINTSGTAIFAGGIQTQTNSIIAAAAANFYWNGRSSFGSSSDGVIRITNNAETDFNRLQFGGTTSSFPSIKRSSAILQARLADDSGYTVLDAQLRAQGTAPATSGATGTAGDIRYDADYIYVCTAANTWKRAAIAIW